MTGIIERGLLMTITGAEKVGEQAGHKVEKRRALGRGLESLLPGPRVVVPQQGGGGAAPSGGDGEQQVPHRAFSPVRNDRVELQGVVDGAASTPAAGPLLAQDARNGAPLRDDHGDDGRRTGVSAPHEAAPPGQLGEVGIPHSVRNDNVGVRDDKVGVGNDNVVVGNDKAGSRNDGVEAISLSAQAESRIPGNIVANIPLDCIEKNPYQTRLIFEEEALEDLAQSIKQSGVVQPVVVRPAEKEGRYILVLGERRLRASKMAGKETIAAIVRRVSELQAAELTIVENMQRENLNCMEQAEAFRVLSKDFNLTQAEIAEKVGVSRESVSNYMRLLKLPHSVQDYLIEGGLGFSEAMVLLQMENEEKLEWLAATAVEKCMNVEQIRDAVMRLDGYLDPKPGLDPNPKPAKGGARWVDPNVRAAQNDLQRLLGMRVRIRDKKGRGKITIEYASVDDYERVVGMLKKQ
jgi:ParB family transcriptional regulator, chromosome partitioning protein